VLLGLGVGGLALCAASPVGVWLTQPLENRFPAVVRSPDHVDGVILLGGSFDLGQSAALGRPVLNEAAGRILTFLALARQYPQAKLVFSGGDPAVFGQGLTEAAVARRLFDQLGVAPERLRFENHSRNTHENAVYSRALVGPTPDQHWLIVTSAVDMPRAIGCFRSAGWAVTPFPADYHASDGDWFPGLRKGLMNVDWATHEWVGLVYYRLRGWIPELLPGPSS
jgi:uncharacterized SAM-binding protein YcdF (DUF218 family)